MSKKIYENFEKCIGHFPAVPILENVEKYLGKCREILPTFLELFLKISKQNFGMFREKCRKTLRNILGSFRKY